MKKAISVNKKSRGRPKKKGGSFPVTAVRLPPPTLKGVDDWAGLQDDDPSRSEAIRRLVELGLKAATPTKATRSTPNKVRAAELAAKAIEKMIDPSASADEHDQRRGRLTKGPPEFREHRVDLPKAKTK
jgi:hypothetical protein